jgi:hypothetical protein
LKLALGAFAARHSTGLGLKGTNGAFEASGLRLVIVELPCCAEDAKWLARARLEPSGRACFTRLLPFKLLVLAPRAQLARGLAGGRLVGALGAI